MKPWHVGEIDSFFPNYELEIIDKAGHWIHSDKPYEVSRLMNEFIQT